MAGEQNKAPGGAGGQTAVAHEEEGPGRFSVTVIEIVCELNRQWQFGPTGQNLRGRWDSHNLTPGDQSEIGLFKMPVIPGMLVKVEPRDHRCSTIDPLSFPENRRILADVNRVSKAVIKKDYGPVDAIVREDVNLDELATWFYWMMRAVKGNCAVVLKGALPESEAEIKKTWPTATIRKKFFDMGENGLASQFAEMMAAMKSVEGPAPGQAPAGRR